MILRTCRLHRETLSLWGPWLCQCGHWECTHAPVWRGHTPGCSGCVSLVGEGRKYWIISKCRKLHNPCNLLLKYNYMLHRSMYMYQTFTMVGTHAHTRTLGSFKNVHCMRLHHVCCICSLASWANHVLMWISKKLLSLEPIEDKESHFIY